MADDDVVGDSEPLLAQDGKSSISLIFLKFIPVVLLVVTACDFFASNFNSRTGETKKNSSLQNIRPFMQELGVKEQHLKKEVCDLSVGKWIPKSAEPAYTDRTCNFIARSTNCLKNGRPDRGYLHWKWQPSACDLPPFDPLKFLSVMRGKSWAFIGDSIFQNHVHALLCLLSEVEQPHDIYHDRTFHMRIWYFPYYDFKIYEIWAPFLVQYETIDNHGDGSRVHYDVHLDILDSEWASVYNRYDYVVITGSAWFYKSSIIYENNQVIGCHYCHGSGLKELGADNVYRKALQLSLKFLSTSEHKPFVIIRTWSPSHYENGESPNERICNRTELYKEGEFEGKTADHKMRRVEIEEFEKAAAIGARNGVTVKLLDTYHLSLLRPDGHPGPYGKYHPFDDGKKTVKNDCLHWCLPGPIDTWNDLIMKMVIDGNANDSVSALF